MRNRHYLGLSILGFWATVSVQAAPPGGKGFSGQSLAPVFRHIGLMPMGDPGLAQTLWRNFDRAVTTIVFPFEELDAAKLEAANTRLHFIADAGKWELKQSEPLLKKLQAKFPKTGWTGGWIFNGDLGSIVTNLREFDEFRKKLDTIRSGPLVYLACRPGQTAAECLPKSVQPFLAGMVWDLTFKGRDEATCLVHADKCKGEAEAFFERLRDSDDTAARSPSWSLRVPLMLLAQVGNPLELLQALYARFNNEIHSVHFFVGVDAATAHKVLKNEPPYRGVRDWLAQVTRWQLERNADLGSNIENLYQSEGNPYHPEATKLSVDRLEATFREPFAMTRFTVTLDPGNRPKRLQVYGGDGNQLFYLRSFRLAVLGPKDRPEKIFTENVYFPRLKRFVVKNEGGRLNAIGALGWPLK